MRLVPLLTAVALAGCQVAPSAAPVTSSKAVAPLSGRVSFDPYATQATIIEVAAGATLSLIDAANNQTVAATVTTPDGKFTLTFSNNFQPESGATYYLEAVKGLQANLPGHAAVRVRTLIALIQNQWHSIVSGQFVMVNSSTTALSIGAALKQQRSPGSVSLQAMLGSFIPYATTYDHAPSGLSNDDYQTLVGLVRDALAGNADPVASIELGDSGWRRITP